MCNAFCVSVFFFLILKFHAKLIVWIEWMFYIEWNEFKRFNYYNENFKGCKQPEARKRHEETHQKVETFTKWMWINIVLGSVGLFALEAFLMPLFDYFEGQYSMNSWHLPYQVKWVVFLSNKFFPPMKCFSIDIKLFGKKKKNQIDCHTIFIIHYIMV